MNLRQLLIFPPIALGIAGYIWMTQPDEETASAAYETRQAVRFEAVERKPQLVKAIGFGRVEAVRSWTGVSQVEGRVIETFPDLSAGTIVGTGALLVQVDQTDYKLSLSKANANIDSAQASIRELNSQETNSKRLLEIEQRILEVTKEEYNRIETLFKGGTTTKSALDEVEKKLLTQENIVINLTNDIELYPAQMASAEATRSVRKAEKAEAERALENTTMNAPFRGRVSAKSVEIGQFIRVGTELLNLEAIDEAEVVGSFQPSDFAALLRVSLGSKFRSAQSVDATKILDVMKRSGISAFVELDFADRKVRYPAELNRFRGGIDDDTGTLGVAVRVKNPLLANASDQRPPLEFGGFVSVVLEAVAPEDVILIPRSVLKQDSRGEAFVYLADAQERLLIRKVTPGPVVGDRILIENGLEVGDRIILSTLQPPIEGMALTLIADNGEGL